MELLDTLRARSLAAGQTARVDCAALGTVTVEALPPGEYAALSSDRAALYAASRELQLAGEQLRSEGTIFTPDQIMLLVTDEEAAAGAAVVRQLSGVRPGFVQTSEKQMAEIRHGTVQDGKGRLGFVQKLRNYFRRIRHGFVQAIGGKRAPQQGGGETVTDAPFAPPEQKRNAAPRLTGNGAEIVGKAENDSFNQDGQVSCEFSDLRNNLTQSDNLDNKPQGVVDFNQNAPPNVEISPSAVVRMEDGATGAETTGRQNGRGIEVRRKLEKKVKYGARQDLPSRGQATKVAAGSLHETTSELGGVSREAVHETTSELGGVSREVVHESKSEFGGVSREVVHETTSELGGVGREVVHETTSELRDEMHETTSELGGVSKGETRESTAELREAVHETTSELRDEMHESTSEFGGVSRKVMHETTSELARETVALLLDGLKRAAAVR